MKQRVEEMEREANKLRELQAAAEKQENASETGGDGSTSMDVEDERSQADSRSIFVGNVRVGTFLLSVHQVLSCHL